MKITGSVKGRTFLDARFEVFMAVKIHVEVFWVVTPCSVVVRYQRFGVWYPITTLNGVTTQKTSTSRHFNN
jgi:hypothetical protein